jgi:hypothetical protein
MEIKLSRGEFWILCVALNAGEGFEALAADEEHIAGYWNLEPHGMNLEHLVDTLCEMFEKKWLQLCLDRPDSIGSFFIPDRDYVHNVFYGSQEDQANDCGHYFYLTPEGGRVWEAFTTPWWAKCYDVAHFTYDEHHERLQVTAGSEETLQEYLKLFPLDGSQIVESTLKFEIAIPWQAKYWKQLPQGYRATFDAIIDWEKSFDNFNYALSYLRDSWVRWK